MNGGCCVESSNSITPRLQMSLEKPYVCPRAISGAKYMGDPLIEFSAIVWSDSYRANPKSHNLQTPPETRTFCGFTSLWQIRLLCRKLSTFSVWYATRCSVSAGSAASCRIWNKSVSASSVTR